MNVEFAQTLCASCNAACCRDIFVHNLSLEQVAIFAGVNSVTHFQNGQQFFQFIDEELLPEPGLYLYPVRQGLFSGKFLGLCKHNYNYQTPGDFSCSIHDSRPQICSKFPANKKGCWDCRVDAQVERRPWIKVLALFTL